jgi:hypothetical protein
MVTYLANTLKDVHGVFEVANMENWQFKLNKAKMTRADFKLL